MLRVLGGLVVVVISFAATLLFFSYLDGTKAPVTTAPSAESKPQAPSSKPPAEQIKPPTASTGTNLISPSEDFSHANWKLERASIIADAEIAPDGKKTADKLVESQENGVHQISTTVLGIRANSTYTVSIFVKPAARDGMLFEILDTRAGKYGTARFNLREAAPPVKAGDILDVGMEKASNGWIRCWATMPFATDKALLNFAMVGPTSQVYTGDGKSDLMIWGAQLENASRPGDYQAAAR